jgi:SSS family solute:Na+ symporter
MAGRNMTAWVAGLSFLSRISGSLELLGWAGSSYQYGILAAHWYWIGAIPAMVFLGLVMMPFYYISRTHSVPGYLNLRYGRATSGLSAISFALMTILMSGVNMYAMAVVMKGRARVEHPLQHLGFVAHGRNLRRVRRTFLCDLQRGGAILPDLVRGAADSDSGADRNRAAGTEWSRASGEFPGKDFTHAWSTLGDFTAKPHGHALDRDRIRTGVGDFDGLLDHRFSGRPARAGGERPALRENRADHLERFFKMAVPFIVILPGYSDSPCSAKNWYPKARCRPGSTAITKCFR